jgi:glycosyltransferase involved in cell wall biosynthesis
LDFECINDRFSTTRRLTRTPTEPDPCFRLPTPHTSNLVGGLRTRGLYKAEGSEPTVTVITASYNCASSIEETMLSVLNQTYSNVEYIVIDGGSTDGTVDVIRKYDHAIDYWISEPDRGIYDAMNKGIRASTGQWLNFMNVKDVFLNNDTVQTLADGHLSGEARFIYSDVLLRNGPYGKGEVGTHICDHEKLVIHHQGSVYQKSLHKEYGLYIVAKGMTISDYLFFSLIDKQNFRKAPEPIALFDMTGVSSTKNTARQKFIVDNLVNGMPYYESLVRFHLLYCPGPIEKLLVGAVRFFRKATTRK